MKKNVLACLAVLALLAFGCEPSGPQTDSQTNWLKNCQADAQCAGLSCICGVCTRACNDTANCSDLAGSQCLPADAAGSIALCGGQQPASAGLCATPCEDGACPVGQACQAGTCSPVREATATVDFDLSQRHQTLIGLGATVGYAEDEIAHHAQKAALESAMFSELGLDLLRFRNRFGDGELGFASASEIIAAATAELGRTPAILLSSWSPPAALKQSGATLCQGNADTCTLSRSDQGAFDYQGFAAYWRSSLEAYAGAGIAPDYIGIQNNPNWAPGPLELGEACKFLPAEGSAQVLLGGVEVEVQYPGFREALAAVRAELPALASPPKVLAPEVSGAGSVAEYVAALDFANVDAVAHHLYGVDPNAVDSAALEALRTLGEENDRPLLQTEMQADGFATAVLLHYALAVEGAAAYVQTALAGPSFGPNANPYALIGLLPGSFTVQDPYHALRHFALYTDPGYVRVDAHSSVEGLLASAWLAPDESRVTLVLVNTGRDALDVALDGGSVAPKLETSLVMRSVLDGAERSAELGQLPPEKIIELPGRAIVTVVFQAQP